MRIAILLVLLLSGYTQANTPTCVGNTCSMPVAQVVHNVVAQVFSQQKSYSQPTCSQTTVGPIRRFVQKCRERRNSR